LDNPGCPEGFVRPEAELFGDLVDEFERLIRIPEDLTTNPASLKQKASEDGWTRLKPAFVRFRRGKHGFLQKETEKTEVSAGCGYLQGWLGIVADTWG